MAFQTRQVFGILKKNWNSNVPEGQVVQIILSTESACLWGRCLGLSGLWFPRVLPAEAPPTAPVLSHAMWTSHKTSQRPAVSTDCPTCPARNSTVPSTPMTCTEVAASPVWCDCQYRRTLQVIVFFLNYSSNIVIIIFDTHKGIQLRKLPVKKSFREAPRSFHCQYRYIRIWIVYISRDIWEHT